MKDVEGEMFVCGCVCCTLYMCRKAYVETASCCVLCVVCVVLCVVCCVLCVVHLRISSFAKQCDMIKYTAVRYDQSTL